MHHSHAALLSEVDPGVLGKRIRSAREARGLSQTDMKREGISASYLSRIESGQRRPTLAVLGALATKLGVSIDEILSGLTPSAYDEICLGLRYAELAMESGEALDAETQARRVLASAEAAGLSALATQARMLHARCLEVLGRLDEATEVYETLLESATGLSALRVGTSLSYCYRESGDLTAAVEIEARIKPLLRDGDLDKTDEAVRFAVTVAAAHAERGDIAKATRICSKAVAAAEALGSARARASAYWNASTLHAERGDTATALELANRALVLLAEGNDDRSLARLRLQLAQLHLRAEHPDVHACRDQVNRARDALKQTSGSVVDLAHGDAILARAHLLAGDLDEAARAATRVLQDAPDVATFPRADALTTFGQVEAARGRRGEAQHAYRTAVRILTAVGADRTAAQLWAELANLLQDVGDTEAALDAMRSALAASGTPLPMRRAPAPAAQLTNIV